MKFNFGQLGEKENFKKGEWARKAHWLQQNNIIMVILDWDLNRDREAKEQDHG